MALNFPSSPVDGQIYYDPVQGTRYYYEAASYRWKSMQHPATIISFGYQVANAAFTHANAAYNQDNTSYASINSNWTVTNALYTLTNTSYASINSNWTVTNALYSVANAAFDAANNVGPQIAPTYNTANAAFIHANAVYTSSNINYITTNANYNTTNVAYTFANAIHETTTAAYASINSNWTVTNALYSVANSAYNSANNVAPQIAPAYNTANASYSYANASNTYAESTFVKLTAPNQTIIGDISITGNLTFRGTAETISSNNLIIGDSLIYLAANNYSGTDILDIGWVANYGNTTGANVHTGLIRDFHDKEYYLFNGLDIELLANNTNFIPYSNGVVNAILNADVRTSNLILGTANAINWIRSSYNTANAVYTSSNANYVVSNSAFALANTTNAHSYGIANGTITVNNIALSGNINPGTVNVTGQTLTDANTINWDVSLGAVATVTLANNRTVAAPTNLKVGTLILHVYQDATGSRTLTWDSVFKWPAGVAPVLTTTGSRHDVLSFVCDGSYLYGSYLPDVR